MSPIGDTILNTVISIIVSIGTGLITGVVVSAYYDLNNLKQNLLYEIRRINYIHMENNEFEIINTPTEISSIRENIMSLTSRALCDFNEKGQHLQELQKEIFCIIDTGQVSDMEKIYGNWQKRVRGLRLSQTDVTRRLKDITCTNIKTKDSSSRKRPSRSVSKKKVWSQMDMDKKNIIDSINASKEREVHYLITIIGIITAFAYFTLNGSTRFYLNDVPSNVHKATIIICYILAYWGIAYLARTLLDSFTKKIVTPTK